MPVTRTGTAVAAVLLVAGQAFGGDGVGPASRPADDTLAACYRWRAWKYGYAVPVYPPVVYSAPLYGSPTYAPLPAAEPPAAPEPITVAPAGRPTIVVGYQGRFFSGSITLRPGARSERQFEVSPPPRPTDSFRYDGGPAQPVPMPTPDPVAPTDPVPNTVPALYRVMAERSRPNVVYPGFGERLKVRPAVVNPVLVRQADR